MARSCGARPGGLRILHVPSADFTDADSWHPSGCSPAYDRVTSRRRHGRLHHPIEQETGGENGAFTIVGQARFALAGPFNGWIVETGDYRALPGF